MGRVYICLDGVYTVSRCAIFLLYNEINEVVLPLKKIIGLMNEMIIEINGSKLYPFISALLSITHIVFLV